VITGGEMLYKPTATAHVADAAPDGMVGRFSSLYAAASISGMFLAPALGGAA
jgi:dipeptide/tripeptide permease